MHISRAIRGIRWGLVPAAALAFMFAGNHAHADISVTKHNLGSTGQYPVHADPNADPATELTTNEICVFCHDPHSQGGSQPIWNRPLPTGPYTKYDANSFDYANLAGSPANPDGDSLLCLSCHDATIPIGKVKLLDGVKLTSSQTIKMLGVEADGTMPAGSVGVSTGFTRRLTQDLSNDHPISFTYDANLAATDGELRDPSTTTWLWNGSSTSTPTVIDKRTGKPAPTSTQKTVPLTSGKVQCTTCHDPHKSYSGTGQTGIWAPGLNIKFLRYNRFQKSDPALNGTDFVTSEDIICLGCHNKDVKNAAAGKMLDWSLSVHANPNVANELYKSGTGSPAALRDFPNNIAVWQAACLNCHDTHTVTGSRHLAREGTNELDPNTNPSVAKAGGAGKSAIEETCFQCHTNSTESILSSTNNLVPNIEDDFRLARSMPITDYAQPIDETTTSEQHEIEDGDFYELPANLGKGNLIKRHAECTDCHNPHRVVKVRKFNDDPTTVAAAGTHTHAEGHTNIASGVLRGMYGVEPVTPYANDEFSTTPTSFDVKKGDGGIGASEAVTSAWVTREYQICFKCHSNYAYDTAPNLGTPYNGTTPSGTNNMLKYTNQAMEFNAPSAHANEGSGVNLGQEGGAASAYDTNNHRSWHPVWKATGRTAAKRGTNSSNWLAPWSNSTGTQTMYCSDCHGSNTTGNTVVPDGGEDGKPWGPHGSSNDFILKGVWNNTVGANSKDGAYSTNALCFKCHNPFVYANGNSDAQGAATGFYSPDRGNLHAYHTDKLERIRCNWCHIAVPHGWKNKAFLVNLNDVGPEVGLAKGTQVRNNTTAAYNKPPYYMNAVLKVKTFAVSHNWSDTNCGSAGPPGNGQTGRDWMRDSSENCVSAP